MCRNIKPLFNLLPLATEEDIQLAALQYVRKISGYRKPSRANEAAFNAAVSAVAAATSALLDQLETKTAPKDRAPKINLPLTPDGS
jgi:hypothetical protein